MTKEGAKHSMRTIGGSLAVIALLLIGNTLDFWYGVPSKYAPIPVKCPSQDSMIRLVNVTEQSLPEEEAAWVAQRSEVVRDVWKAYLNRAGLSGFDVDAFVKQEDLPTVALAFSGGGNRAMLVGAGVIRAMDDRIPEAVELGTGGILQIATYISGLSGGSFLIGSMFTTNWPTIDELHNTVWDLRKDAVTPSGSGSLTDIGVYSEFLRDLAHKARAGYPTTITDYWARLISVKTTNSSGYGVGVTMSGLAEYSNFKNHKTPFPVVVWNERLPGETGSVSDYANVWESSMIESGSWSPTISAFINTKYLGTSLKNGKPTTQACTTNFDQFGFVVGISSSIFNLMLQDIDNSTNNRFLDPVINYMTHKEIDAALVPNPFYKHPHIHNSTSSVELVSLVDGGEDGQNVPLWPFLQPARSVDVLFATDSTASSYEGGFTHGGSLIKSAEYAAASGVKFPDVPATEDEFVSEGVVDSNVFFGCDRTDTPLVVYIPNRYYSYPSNASTFRRVYNPSESWPFLLNGFDLLAQEGAQKPVNGFKSGQHVAWKTCLACAMVSRKVKDLTDECKTCMDAYCWKPKEDKEDVFTPDTTVDLHPRVVQALKDRERFRDLMLEEVEIAVESALWQWVLAAGLACAGVWGTFVYLVRKKSDGTKPVRVDSATTSAETQPLVG